MDIVGVVSLIVGILALIYAYFNTEHPQIEYIAYTGVSLLGKVSIRLKNIGDVITIVKIQDSRLYLNSNAIINVPLKWNTEDELVFYLKEEFSHIPADFEIKLLLKNKSNNLFLCRIKKLNNGIDIKIKRKILHCC